MKKQYFRIFAVVLAMVFSFGMFSADTFANAKVAVSAEQAEKIALTASGGGFVKELKLESKSGFTKYEIDIHNGNMRHEIDIDANSGNIIKHEQKMKKERYNAVSQSGSVITAAQAQATAMNIAGSGEVVKNKFSGGPKNAHYSILIISGDSKYKVDVDAYTNKVMRYEHKAITELKVQPSANMITPDRAKAIALQQTGGGTVIECELKHEKKFGAYVYDVDVVKDGIKYEYKINSLNSNIIEYEVHYKYNVSEKR